MRLIERWQYKYIEKCLYEYPKLCSADTLTDTEVKMVMTVKQAIKFFEGTTHIIMLEEYYFNADKYRKKLTTTGHYRHICNDVLHTDESNGYIMKREIIYRVAMNCYALRVFK
jgi:hypothetical protein